jgi:hypothetical protein
MNAWHNAVLALILASCSAHAEEWKAADYKLLGAATALIVVDWGQTRNMTRSPLYITRCPDCKDPYYEHNPILGKSPSIGEVDKYFALAILGTVGVSYALPAKWRRYFLGGVIVLESAVVMRNHHIGLRAEF